MHRTDDREGQCSSVYSDCYRDKPYYDRMHAKLQSNKRYAEKIKRKRSSTVEPVLGTLINYTNMRRVNTRGMASANKHVLMAALTYNLKKYMRYISKNIKSKMQAMELPATNNRINTFYRFITSLISANYLFQQKAKQKFHQCYM